MGRLGSRTAGEMRKTGNWNFDSRNRIRSVDEENLAAATARVKPTGRCPTTGVAGTRKRGKNEGQTQAVRNRDEPDGRLMRIGMRIGGSRESALSLEGE
jgi:hypothetical protein